MEKKTKILAVIGTSILLLGACIGGSKLLNNKPIKNETEKIVYKYKTLDEVTEKMFDNYINIDVTEADIKSITDEEFIYYEDIPFIKDGFYNSKLTKEQKDGKNLSEYEKAHDKYLKNLQKVIEDNLEYEVNGEDLDGPIITKQKVTVKSFLWWAYRMDFRIMYEALLDAEYGIMEVSSTVDDMNEEEKAKYIINAYKAKVKAFQIMDNELERYINKDKTYDMEILYEKKSIDGEVVWRATNAVTVYNTLSGISYGKVTQEDIQKRVEEVFGNSYNKFIIINDYLSLDIPEDKITDTEEVDVEEVVEDK